MTQSKMLFAAVAVAGFALTMAGLIAAPFDQSARAADNGAASATQRIEAAFTLAHPELQHAVPVRISKGDLPGCVGQTWPNIAADCLATADGAPARKARMVTFGQQIGESETVLVRFPVSEVAMR